MKNPQLEQQLTVVENSLQERFNGVSTKELGALFSETELKKGAWLVSAVMFGMKCIAVKPKIGHGKFTDFIIKALKDTKSINTARGYIGLANKVIAQIALPDEANEIGARVIAYFAGANGKKPKFDSVLETEESIAEILRYLLEGFSLHGLTKALQGIDMQLAIEGKCANAGERVIPADKAGEVQLSFERELFAPIGEIQNLVKSDSFASLPKDKALEFAEALIAEGMQLKRKLTKASEGR